MKFSTSLGSLLVLLSSRMSAAPGSQFQLRLEHIQALEQERQRAQNASSKPPDGTNISVALHSPRLGPIDLCLGVVSGLWQGVLRGRLALLGRLALSELGVTVEDTADHAERHVDGCVGLERLAEQQHADEGGGDLVQPSHGGSTSRCSVGVCSKVEMYVRCRRRDRDTPEGGEVEADAQHAADEEQHGEVEIAEQRVAPDREGLAVEHERGREQRQRDEVVVEGHAELGDLERRARRGVAHVQHVGGRGRAVEEHPEVARERGGRGFAAHVAVRGHDGAHEHDAETDDHEAAHALAEDAPLAHDDDDVGHVLEDRHDVDGQPGRGLHARVQHGHEEEGDGRPLARHLGVVRVVRDELLHLGQLQHQHGHGRLHGHHEELLLEAVVLLAQQVAVRQHHHVRHERCYTTQDAMDSTSEDLPTPVSPSSTTFTSRALLLPASAMFASIAFCRSVLVLSRFFSLSRRAAIGRKWDSVMANGSAMETLLTATTAGHLLLLPIRSAAEVAAPFG
ncbi:hypothetical protein ON010_g6517 [Phytophthora cinnamomi]|nr:hypothetical protein ON010_g6517 [Phytophthora cinnamomi]